MTVNGLEEPSLRPSRSAYKRLLWALAISLAIHGGGYGGYRLERAVMPGLLQRFKILAALADALRKKPDAKPPTPSEPPLAFVEVNPSFATPEPPKEAKYYSSQNSHAANPDATIDSNIPKITGKQQEVTKTEDAPRKFDKLMPTPAPAKETQQAEQAKPKPPVGDLAMAKPETILQPDNGNAEHTRPRTLAEARARQPSSMLPGQKMHQEGGVHRHLEISTLDATATPFGEYDRQFVEAVQQHWYFLLDSMNFADDRHGRVVLQFHLNYDGSISDMQVLDDNVDPTSDGVLGFLCQRAVIEPARYPPWPREMRLQMDRNYREITFTFFYD